MPDSPGLTLVEAPDRMWRVERTDTPLLFSRINAVDGGLDRSGNRFDIPGAGVLYSASDPVGAYAETLAGFRVSAALVQAFNANGQWPTDPAPGEVPASSRSARRIRSFGLPTSLPFVDVDSPGSHTHLTLSAPQLLTEFGLSNLDVATVRGPSRRLTRALAAWLFSQTDPHGAPLYAGIRYGSRLGPYECWAIFEGTQTRIIDEHEITNIDPALHAVAEEFSLTIG